VIVERRAGRSATVRFREEEILGRRLADLLPPSVRPGFEAAFTDARRTGQLVCVEYPVETEDGHKEFEARFARIAGGQVVTIVREITDRVSTEQALRAREERFRRLTENASDMVQLLDATARIIYSGPSVERLLGWTAEEIEGTSAWDFLHPDDVPGALEELARLSTAPGTTRAVEYRVRHRSGEWRHFEANCRTFSPTSAAEGFVVNARDVTDRKLAAEALRRSEERYRILIETTHDIITTLDPKGRFVTYQSPAFERSLGWAPAEMQGRDASELVHPDDLAQVHVAVKNIIVTPGSTGYAEYRYRHKDGSWRRMETFGRTMLPDSAEAGVVLNTRDVTERWQAEEALRRSEEHFRALTENATDLISLHDAEGRYVYQSPSIERVLGYTSAEILGHQPWEFVHPEDLKQAVDTLMRIPREPGTSYTVQLRMRARDGSWRVLESTGRTLLPDSADEGVLVISRDVTSRREAEEALRRAREEAEQANHAKSEFLSRMSHELRTPLNSILGFAQLLEGAELAPRYQKGVQHILTAGEHLLNLINEVLDIARIESGRQQLSIEPVRLGTVMQEAVGLVRPLAAARGVWVSESFGPAADAFVRADKQRLAQVLLNLLSNAVKYNRGGGQVRLTCEPMPGATFGSGRIGVRVEDTGRGIPEDKLGELFVPFARLGAEASEVEGTGLGLALSQRLVEAMGGTLELERTSAAGSVFRVELEATDDPVREAVTHSGIWPVPVPPGSGKPATLLYIEDNLANLSLVEQILEARPEWRLVPALQGRLGVDLAREHLPDVVLLDLHLPDIPGDEVLRQLRADPRTARIPIVVISADATPKAVERLRVAGATAYLTKPLRVHRFVRTIEAALGGGESS
jgi:PAS domain S-box-containing protein